MTKTSVAKYRIEKFNGKNNFDLWCIKMCILLVNKKLLKMLQGKKKMGVGTYNEERDKFFDRALNDI